MPDSDQRKVLLIKVVHSVIFWLMCGCVVYIYYAALARTGGWYPYLAIGLVCAEGAALLLNRGRCPLTTLALRYGAVRGSVTDIFLPGWAAARVFPVCTVLFVVGVGIFLVNRMLASGP
jgi:hypothetical protein